MGYLQLKKDYERLLKVVRTRPGWVNVIHRRVAAIMANKSKYQEVTKITGVPWEFIGIVHSLEGDLNFNTHLHNGDSLQRRTSNVPAGRPIAGNPPFSWTASAIDALKMKGLHLIKEWSLSRYCYELERYNGFGYRLYHSSTLSPYLWSGTNLYTRGKYVKDGKWSSIAVSQQSGAIPILLELKSKGKNKMAETKLKLKRTYVKKLKTKPWYSSRTIQGLGLTALSLLPIIGQVVGFPLEPAMIQQIGEHGTKLVEAVGGLAGLALALYGRKNATVPLSM